jgi:hypothetical protein
VVVAGGRDRQRALRDLLAAHVGSAAAPRRARARRRRSGRPAPPPAAARAQRGCRARAAGRTPRRPPARPPGRGSRSPSAAGGRSRVLDRRPVRTRPSCTDVAGSPTMAHAVRPSAMSTSASTAKASTAERQLDLPGRVASPAVVTTLRHRICYPARG